MDSQNTVPTLFETQVERAPQAVAVVFGNQSITYGELNERVNQLAHYLRALGVKSDTQVALCMERSIELLVVVFAILKAGAGYLPLDPAHPDERLLFTLKDSKTSILLTESSLKDKFICYDGKVIVLEQVKQEIVRQPTSNPSTVVGPQHLAYIIYTSGSTGKPKGVQIEQRSVVNYCQWFGSYTGCKPEQRVDFSANYIFDMAVSLSIVPLMLGLTIVIGSDELKQDIRAYINYLEAQQINLIKITPSYFRALVHEVKATPVSLTSLQTIILGGENLTANDCLAWLSLYPKHCLFNEYGPTEATVAVSAHKVCETALPAKDSSVSIGKPGPNMYYYLLDADDKPVEHEEIGELHIGGLCLARGYLNQPELSAKKFIKDPFSQNPGARLYKTGDLCKRLEDGSLEYLGRIDQQIKIRGFRIEPGEIEASLANYPGIAEVVIIGQNDTLMEKRLVAYYRPKTEEGWPTSNQLRQYLQACLPDYMVPSFFVPVAKFPLTSNGKLDRAALPVPQFTSSQDYVKPRTTLEKTLAKIWSEELGIKSIGLEDNFFELGGHSLSAARIISQIRHSLRKDVTLDDFYHALTIEKLAQVVSAAKRRKRRTAKNVEHHDIERLPLGDFQLLFWLSNTYEPKAKKLNIVARKRVKGPLNLEALSFAFEAVLKKQEILSYRILKSRPAQLPCRGLAFKLSTKNLESYSEEAARLELETSLKELRYYVAWNKSSAKLVARLFFLSDKSIELQICMPHIIVDDVSSDILFSDLSKFYLLKNQLSLSQIKSNKHYRDFLFKEQHYLQAHLDRDLAFWTEYLKDANLFVFPCEEIVKEMEPQFSYSTYTEIPEAVLAKLQHFCAENIVSINDSLSAALALAISNCSANEEQNFLMNIVKSTRDNPSYDDTIGCFLRIDPIKVKLRKESTFTSLAKQIHQAAIDVNPYQRCSNLVKLSCLKIFQKKNLLKDYLLKAFFYVYTALFRSPRLNPKVLSLCARLHSLEHSNNFVVNVNVQSSFIPGVKTKKEMGLFGLKCEKIAFYRYDLLKINNVFDVCFLRDENQETPYLVISANLRPDFRALIARETIRIISCQTICNKEKEKENQLS